MCDLEPGRWLSMPLHWRRRHESPCASGSELARIGTDTHEASSRTPGWCQSPVGCALQAAVAAIVSDGSWWQDMAQCRETWSAFEPAFVRRGTRTHVPPTAGPHDERSRMDVTRAVASCMPYSTGTRTSSCGRCAMQVLSGSVGTHEVLLPARALHSLRALGVCGRHAPAPPCVPACRWPPEAACVLRASLGRRS